tara:strand:+ start:5526 stop:5741 length:216 start_codon:yes stop_codon:yes gene_type:complete
MANKPNGVIYIGVTDNIEERVREHKNKIYPKFFIAKYNCENLIYFEEFENGEEASIREKQFKSGKEIGKLN